MGFKLQPSFITLSELQKKWRTNADMLAEGNKDEFADPSVEMQRACAADLQPFIDREQALQQEPRDLDPIFGLSDIEPQQELEAELRRDIGILVREKASLQQENERLKAALTVSRIETAPKDDVPDHVCGLSGYNGMIDPPCPACE